MLTNGLAVKLLVVAGVAIVTMSPVTMESTIPRGPYVYIENVLVGCSEGGLYSPFKITVMFPLVISALKHPVMLMVETDDEITQVDVENEAEDIETFPKAIVEGKSNFKYPPAGMRSGRTA